jgi:hypothetical protein
MDLYGFSAYPYPDKSITTVKCTCRDFFQVSFGFVKEFESNQLNYSMKRRFLTMDLTIDLLPLVAYRGHKSPSRNLWIRPSLPSYLNLFF